MRLICLLLAIFVGTGIAQAQKEVLSNISVSGKTPEAFIPKGFEVMELKEGDLNKDGVADIAMALNSPALEKSANDAARILLVLFKT